MTPQPALMTTAEVADELRVHQKTVRQWAEAGRIPVITLPGGTLRFRREDVDSILAGSAPNPSAA